MEKLPLSVAIITHNEEHIIEATLNAVRDIASEIVVVDCGSTDRTREIARACGASVYEEEWKGYAEQKNSALSKCNQEWILFLDADEIVSEELKRAIIRELQKPKANGYLLNRLNYYLGKPLKYTWQPEWRLRLVKRDAGPRWQGDPHEQLTVQGKSRKLRGILLHYSYTSVADHIQKNIKYACLIAEKRYREASPWRVGICLWASPIWSFIKIYLIKGGVLDGWRGFVAASITAFYTFVKYAFMLELHLKEKYGKCLWQPKGNTTPPPHNHQQ